MNSRRSFLKILGGGISAAVAGYSIIKPTDDPERALWVPGQKKIFLPNEIEVKNIAQAVRPDAVKGLPPWKGFGEYHIVPEGILTRVKCDEPVAKGDLVGWSNYTAMRIRKVDHPVHRGAGIVRGYNPEDNTAYILIKNSGIDKTLNNNVWKRFQSNGVRATPYEDSIINHGKVRL